jgi:hypothetical protein
VDDETAFRGTETRQIGTWRERESVSHMAIGERDAYEEEVSSKSRTHGMIIAVPFSTQNPVRSV